MQLHNEAYGAYAKELEVVSESNILGLAASISQIYETIVGKDDLDSSKNVIGQSNQLYYSLLNCEE
jgi:hypothetical protein